MDKHCNVKMIFYFQETDKLFGHQIVWNGVSMQRI